MSPRNVALSIGRAMPEMAVSTGAMLGGGRDVRAVYLSYNGGSTWEETYSRSPSLAAAQGKMVTARMAQACYHNDPNVTGQDADDNAAHFRAQLAAYRAAGVLCWSVGMEGGNPFRGSSGDALNVQQTGISYGNGDGEPSAFTSNGTALKADHQARLEALIEVAADEGMVICLMLFYSRQGGYLSSQANYEAAIATTCDWLKLKGYRNVVIDLANEAGIDASGNWPASHLFTTDAGAANMVAAFKDEWTGEPWRPPIGCSSRSKPGPLVMAESDIHWFHGNVAGSPMPGNRDNWCQDILNDASVGPVVCNEDEPQTEENGPTVAQWDEEQTAFLSMNDIVGVSGGTMIANAWQRYHSDTALPFWPEPSGGSTSLDSGLSYKVKWENFTQRWLNLVEAETGGLAAP